MTAVAVIAVTAGAVVLIGGAIALIGTDAEAFVFAVGVTAVFAAAAWGLSYLTGGAS